MNDAILRLFDEVLWSLRREGIAIATTQAIDCMRALAIVGFDEREVVFETIASIVCQTARDREHVRRVMSRLVAEPRPSLWERLARDFTEDELDALRAVLKEALAAFAERGAELDRRVAIEVARARDEPQGPLRAGFYAHRALERAGYADARAELAAARLALRDALGDRGDALADALARELEDGARLVRDHVRARVEASPAPATTLDQRAFASLDAREIEEVRRAVRSFAQRLVGRARVRKRHARRGKIDPHRALRRALRTGGAPFVLPRRRRRDDKPSLVILCDVSDSVRSAATFLLELVHVAHDLFERTRSFVFVSELAESTRAFEERTPDEALALVFGGALVPTSSNSSYGRALDAFARAHLPGVDARTTVVVLGDGRTNYAPDGLPSLRAIAARAGAVLWLCPEPPSTWGTGDSAMLRYRSVASETFAVSTARELEHAARRLVYRR